MRKTVTILFVCAFMILTSCKPNNRSDTENKNNAWRIVSFYKMVESDKNGMFAVDSSDSLVFLDFSTMEESPICDDPTCKHTSAEICSSFNKNNHPFIYNNKLYYFVSTDLYEENGKLIQDTQLWQSDINGSNEKQLYTFKGFTYYNYDTMLLDGDTIYMCMSKITYDGQFNELEPSVNFFSFELEEKKATDYGELISGYSSGGYIYGMWDNKVIIEVSAAKINKPYMERFTEFAEKNNISEEEAIQKYVDEYDMIYMGFDISSKEFNELEFGDSIGVSQNNYYIIENDCLMYYDTDKKEHKIDGVSKIDYVNALNDFVSFNDDSTTYLFDESKKKLLELNNYYDIIAVYDKDNVIFKIVNNDGSTSYEKKLISELVKKA